MIVQIYEINNAQEAAAVAALGVDHIGVLVGKGEFPREKNIEEARDIFASVPARHKKVALPLTADLAYIERLISELRPDIVHIGGLLNQVLPEHVAKLKKKYPQMTYMRAMPVINEQSIARAKEYEGLADFLLLDTKIDPAIIGATGQTHDWGISQRIVEEVNIPVILAGGLGPGNVVQAIKQVRPVGVDSKTKTDKTDGSNHKDLEKVKELVRLAKQAAGGDGRN